MSKDVTRYSLIERALDLNDQEAWRELEAQYKAFIFHVLKDAGVPQSEQEDIAQNVLVTLSQNLKSYDKEKGKFRSWFATVLKRASYAYLKSKKSRVLRENKYFENSVSEEASDLDVLIEDQWKLHVTNLAFDRVRESFRGQSVEVFQRLASGESVESVMEATGLARQSIYTMKMRVQKSLAREVRYVMDQLEYD